jgi:hypothetical protein
MSAPRRVRARFGLLVAGLLVTVLSAAVLAGCAQGTTGPGGASPTPSRSFQTGPPISTGKPPVSTTPPLPGTSPSPPPVTALVTLRGTMVEGVEAGCRILKAENGKNYELLGMDEALVKPGIRVEVRGRVAVGMVSYCMQGIMFRVSTARRI